MGVLYSSGSCCDFGRLRGRGPISRHSEVEDEGALTAGGVGDPKEEAPLPSLLAALCQVEEAFKIRLLFRERKKTNGLKAIPTLFQAYS